jgi:tRNA nucleotidyltransferase/poly(A) polymerase
MLQNISAERVRDELAKLLAQPDAFSGVRHMDNLGLLRQVLPEVTALRGVEQSLPHHWPVFEHTLFVLAALERMVANGALQTLQPHLTGEDEGLSTQAFVWHDAAQILSDWHDQLAAHLSRPSVTNGPHSCRLLATLLHDCAKPRRKRLTRIATTHFTADDAGAPIAAERVRMLRFNNAEVERVRVIIANHMRPSSWPTPNPASRAGRRTVTFATRTKQAWTCSCWRWPTTLPRTGRM